MVSKYADEKYVAFTTFKKDGTAKPSPVWIVDAGDGRVGFTTSLSSWKIKRLRNNSRVEIQPSDAKGRTKEGTKAVSATAEIVEGSEFEAVSAQVKNKYGFQVKIVNLMHFLPKLVGKETHPSDCAVVITLDEQ